MTPEQKIEWLDKFLEANKEDGVDNLLELLYDSKRAIILLNESLEQGFTKQTSIIERIELAIEKHKPKEQ